MPPAAAWSRSRHSGLPGQPPLRSRTAPLGLSALSPFEDEKVRSANLVLEILAWCAEQALECAYKAVGLNLIFPEDLGGSPRDRLQFGCCVKFNFWRAVVMLAAQLGTCASLREQITSDLWGSSQRRFTFEVVFPWVGLTWKTNTGLG